MLFCAIYGFYGAFTHGLFSVYSLLAVAAIYAAATHRKY